jgi:hypothetical protein
VTADIDIVDTWAIAIELGVVVRTVHSWRRRDIGFPEPAGRAGGRPYWKWKEVQKWAKETGRA